MERGTLPAGNPLNVAMIDSGLVSDNKANPRPSRPRAGDCGVMPDVLDLRQRLHDTAPENQDVGTDLWRQRSASIGTDLWSQQGRSLDWLGSGSPASRRSRSWSAGDFREHLVDKYRQMCSPGGFRRNYLHVVADGQGVPHNERPEAWSRSLSATIFLDLLDDLQFSVECFGEHQKFLPSFSEGHRACRTGLGSLGIAVAIFKGNLNANVLYMPHAWKDTGWIFSLCVLPSLGFLSTVCVIRLLRCRRGNSLSYGQLMDKAGGRVGRIAVNMSVTLLQCGCCCLYLINVANLMQATIFPWLSKNVLIILEALIICPLATIRNIARLGYVNAVASILVIFAITATLVQLILQLADRGSGDEFIAVKPSGMLVGLGTACFVFEGIGLVTSIYDSCRHPEKFNLVYSLMIGGVCMLISIVAFLGYYSFGSSTETLVLINFPGGWMQQAIKLAMGIAMLCTFPLQLLPAVRLAEDAVGFEPSQTYCEKCRKSIFRILFVALLAGVAIGGATSLNNFVSLIGALCGLPLAYVYPAICHLNLVSGVTEIPLAQVTDAADERRSFFRRRWQGSALVDIGFIIFGVTFTVVITVTNIVSWGSDAG